jgi:Cu-Zn family superoxide dismutase
MSSVLFLIIASAFPIGIFAQDASPDAMVRLQDAAGAVVGFVNFTQTDTYVDVIVDVYNMPPGFHGVQIHANGSCDTGDTPFAGIGAPLGADASDHPNQIGDLPTMLVLADGTGYMRAVTDRFAVADLFDDNGSSVMVYANAANYANIPSRYGVTADQQTLTSGDMGAGIACGVLDNPDRILAAEGNLWALQRLPLTSLPASVYRGENAEEADLTLTLNALGGVQIPGRVEGANSGIIGSVNMEGDFLVFTFNNVNYNVFPLEIPGGFSIGQQSIMLDPNQTSTIRVNMTTGEIQRNFFWIQTATDVLYNGQPSVPLGDTAETQVAEVRNLGNDRYVVRMLTNWQSTINLTSWEIGGVSVPAGEIIATADFDGVYILDFNQ